MSIIRKFWNWLRGKLRKKQPPLPVKEITVAKIETPEPEPRMGGVYFLNPQPGYRYDLRRPEQIEIKPPTSTPANQLHITHTARSIHGQLVTRKKN